MNREQLPVNGDKIVQGSVGAGSVDALVGADELGRLTHRCAELVGASAARMLVVDASGKLATVAAAGQKSAHLAAVFDLAAWQGPCVESFHARGPIIEGDLAAAAHRWALLAALAQPAGMRAVLVIPLHWQADMFGVLAMVAAQPYTFTSREVEVGQDLADVAGVCLHAQHSARQAWTLADQLQGALNSRVVIEQAKGMLAQRAGMSVDDAFEALRTYSRSNRVRLTEVCRGVVDGTGQRRDLLNRLAAANAGCRRGPSATDQPPATSDGVFSGRLYRRPA